MVARARNTDPVTSHKAAEEVEANGSAESQRAKCLKYVLNRPGVTSAEIAAGMKVDRHIPGRRLSELKDAGKLVQGHSRVCEVTGRACVTWWPAGKRQGELFA